MLCDLLHAKLYLFLFDVTSAASNWQFISICSCFIRDSSLSVVKLAWPRCLQNALSGNF